MEVDLRRESSTTSLPKGMASPPPYDPLLPTPVTHVIRSASTSQDQAGMQMTRNDHPVSMDTPTRTPHDLFCLAKEYERRGRTSDAANLYLKASMNGHLSAMVSYASQLVASDERAAFVWFRAAAERGDPRAWSELGQLLARGGYFEVNAIDAARCWKRAAQMGDNTGKSALGLCYIRGFGVKQDAEKGVEIVRQVADVHNDVTAMKNLAWIYRHGKGVPKNLKEADYWDNRAKRQQEVMVHVTTRERVLFGRVRPSLSKLKSDEKVNRKDSTIRPTKASEDDINRRLRAVSQAQSAHLKPEKPFKENRPFPVPLNKADSPVTATIPSFQQCVQNLEQKALETSQDSAIKTHSVRSLPDKKRKSGTQADGQNIDVSEVDLFKIPASEIQSVETLAAKRAALEASREESSAELRHATRSPVLLKTQSPIPSSNIQETEEYLEEQFKTPDQSLENEETQEDSQLHGFTEISASSFAHKTGGVLPTNEDTVITSVKEVLADPGRASVEDVESRAMAFESSGDGINSGLRGSGPHLQSRNSYSIPGSSTPGRATPGHEELDEFEEADMQNMQQAVEDSTTSNQLFTNQSSGASKGFISTVKETTTYKDHISKTKVLPVISSGGSKSVETAQRRSPFQDRSRHSPGSASFTQTGGKHAELRNVLALYPRNPLRADSQVPLFKILDAIQRIPITDTEAYDILAKSNGYSKVVVAMLSQAEDEFLQEQGIHCILRILKTTPDAERDALILTSYAVCYRRMQGDEDAVIPKGSTGINDEVSGAIQAITYAMRKHSLVRRVQLAGAAALSEVVPLSSTCKAVAYENGAVGLIITCLQHRSSPAAASIHDLASRAVSSFCSGKENIAFKEAFTNAGAITELLQILQIWGHSAGSALQLPGNATRSSCNALREITDGYPVAGGLCVKSFAYHQLIRAMVVRREDVSVCSSIVSAMTSITRNAGAIAEKGLLDAKPLPEVLITMQKHSAQPSFICKSLDFMEALGSFGSMKEEIVTAGGIPFAADIIKQGGNDSLLLERACGVIEKLCRSHAKHQDIFNSHGGIASLATLLRTHQSLPTVVERALFAFTSACSHNVRAQKEGVKHGAPEQVVRCIGAYSSDNAKVVGAGASTAAALVVPKNQSIAQELSKLKAPELVVRAMKKHPDSVVVQENGAAAIASVCEAETRIISTLLKSGISSVLVIAMQRFLHKKSAVGQISRAMRALCNEASEDSYRFKSKLLTDRSNESSLSEIFHTALSYHKKFLPDTSDVIVSICATINRLCMKSVVFKNEIGKDGIVEELKRLTERVADMKDTKALQPVLATICTLVLDCEDNKNRFHAAGGVETILDVMQKWKSETYILEHCCAALRYSCNEHFGNCDEVKNHNGVRSILGVMELHPDNANVTLWCCLTLSDLCKGDEELQSSHNVALGIRKVISAMNMFTTNARLLASACEFLRAVSVDHSENQERIVRLGGRTAIVKALESHPGDNTLTEAGAYALLQIQDVKDVRASVDGASQGGLVRRISRDLRRSGSRSSAKSGRSSGRVGLLGRKSRSFARRKQEDDDAVLVEEDQEEVQEMPAISNTGRSSFLGFRRGRSKSRKERKKSSRITELEEEPRPVEGADDGYGEYDKVAVEGGAYDQME